MFKHLLIPVGLALIAAAPGQGGGHTPLSEIVGRGELTDGASGYVAMRIRLAQYPGALRGQMVFRFQDASGRRTVDASFRPNSEDAFLKGNMTVFGTQASYVGPGTLTDADSKGRRAKSGFFVVIISDRHQGDSPAPGAGDTVWIMFSPDDGSDGFSYSGIVTRGDLTLTSTAP